MTLSTDLLFITTDVDGFRECREKRTTHTDTMTVLYCKTGHIDVYYHGSMLRINTGDLFVRVPDFSHELGPYKMSPDFEFMQVTVSASVYEQLMYEHMRVEPNWYGKQEYVKDNPIFPLTGSSVEVLDVYFKSLTLQLEKEQTEYRKQILMLIARAAMMELLDYMDRLAIVDNATAGRRSVNSSDYTFREFTRLLQQYPHKREVQWYAKQLDITPKYLSEICKERSDKSASEWIADITVAEIKHYLHHTVLPIREIAQVMEFPNASFFCQYTKKHTGLTPNHFRKEKKN